MWQNLTRTQVIAVSARTATAFVIAGLVVLAVVLCAGIVFLGLRYKKVYEVKERYDLIAAQSECIWLDYTFSPQHLVVTGSIGQFTGFDMLDFMGVEVYDIYNWVNEDITPIRSTVRSFFDSGEQYFKTDLLIRRLDDTYAWYALTGTLVKHEKTGRNKRFVVRMENIDSKMTQEKELTEKAENDQLTGILNKKTMEERGYTLLILRLTDVLLEGSQLLYLGDEDIITQAFGVQLKDHTCFLPGIVSRKKQVIPSLTALWG